MTASERTFEVFPGLRLAARVHGPEDGAPLLAMHGWLDNAATFDGLAPLLPGRRIVALDFAGHGLSGRRVGALRRCTPDRVVTPLMAHVREQNRVLLDDKWPLSRAFLR